MYYGAEISRFNQETWNKTHECSECIEINDQNNDCERKRLSFILNLRRKQLARLQIGEMELMSYFKDYLKEKGVISWYAPDTEEWKHEFHSKRALCVLKNQQVREH